MPRKKYNEATKQMRDILETTANEAGRNSGFVQRTSKLTASCFAQALVLGCLKKENPTLSDFVQICGSLGVEVSNSGFNQRIDEEAVALLKALMEACIRLTHPQGVAPTVLARFTAVNIVDSSYVALPRALHLLFPGLGRGHAAGAKVMLRYDYLRGEVGALEVVAGRTPDQTSRLHVHGAQPGSLTLFDLGFFKQEVFRELADQEAYFISRYQLQTGLYSLDQQPFELVPYLRATAADQLSLPLLVGKKVKLPVRVVCQRLPDAVAAERRRKARQKAKADGRRQGTPSSQSWYLLGWSIFITNIPEEWLTVDQIQLLYPVRWQIELLFKFWKSRAQLDQMGSSRPTRILCQFYARLIGILLFHRLAAPTYCRDPQLSLPKAFSLFQHHLPSLWTVIARSWRGCAALLARIEAHWLRLGMKDKRKKSPSTYSCLLEAGL